MSVNEFATVSEKELFWRRLFRLHSEEKISVRELCCTYGVSIPSYYVWKRKLEKSPSPDSSFPFAELRVAQENEARYSDAIEVMLHNGRLLRVGPGFDETTFARLISLLESDGC